MLEKVSALDDLYEDRDKKVAKLMYIQEQKQLNSDKHSAKSKFLKKIYKLEQKIVDEY